MLRRCDLLLETEQRSLSVCLCVTVMSAAITVEPIEMPFGLRTRVGPRNHVLDLGLCHPQEAVILREGMGGQF